MRVATFSNSSQMLAASLRTQSRLSELQIQSSSGVKSTDYGGLGSLAGQVIDLESAAKRATSYSDTATTVGDRIESMYSALSSITDLITSFKTTLSGATATQDADSLITSAATFKDELVDLLNTRYQGRYLFAGSRTDTAPVDTTDIDYAMDDLETANSDYYQGDSVIASAKVSPNQVINYGVTADGSGFEQVLRVFSSFANATTVTDDQIATAIDLLAEGMDDILVAQTKLSSNADAASRAADRQSAIASATSDLSATYKEVDIAAVSVQLTTYESQLEASYAALAKISKLSLLNYQ